MNDTYKTLSKPAKGDFRDRGSKFFAYAFRVFSTVEAKERLNDVKNEHPKARHHCFAFRIGLDGQQYRANDDGEPSGTAGRPILGQIDSYGLTNAMVIVVRYFGGTKLGVPGLINAYKQATIDAFEEAEMEERTVDHLYLLEFEYAVMSDVMNFIKKDKVEVISQEFAEVPVINIAIRQSEAEAFENKAKKIKNLRLTFLDTR